MHMSKMNASRSSEHRTADINYAAYLKVAGISFLGTERVGHRVVYRFEVSSALEELKLAYFNREARVVALDYVAEIKAMRVWSYAD